MIFLHFIFEPNKILIYLEHSQPRAYFIFQTLMFYSNHRNIFWIYIPKKFIILILFPFKIWKINTFPYKIWKLYVPFCLTLQSIKATVPLKIRCKKCIYLIFITLKFSSYRSLLVLKTSKSQQIKFKTCFFSILSFPN